jgi:hypothetical protein
MGSDDKSDMEEEEENEEKEEEVEEEEEEEGEEGSGVKKKQAVLDPFTNPKPTTNYIRLHAIKMDLILAAPVIYVDNKRKL